MEKEENQNNTPEDENQNLEKETEKPEESSEGENEQETPQETKEEIKEPTPEEKIAELEDKLSRTFAEIAVDENGTQSWLLTIENFEKWLRPV